MCKKQITPNDCFEYLTELEDSIQSLYMSIDNFLFQDIDRSVIQGLLPQWVCDGGRSPELALSKEMYERLKQKFDKPIIRRFIYYYDLWNIIAAIQDRFGAVGMFMREFYATIPYKVVFKEPDYTSAVRNCGQNETEIHINLNGIFVALASTFDLLSKIAIEQGQFSKYGDFSKYSSMKSGGKDGLFNIKKLIHLINPALVTPGMLFAENRDIRIVETFRNEYVHNGPWDLRCSVYYTAVNGEPADVIVFASDIDEHGNFVSSGARNKFYSQGNMINVILPTIVKSVLETLKRTIECLTNLYNTGITQTPDKDKTMQWFKDIADCNAKFDVSGSKSDS